MEPEPRWTVSAVARRLGVAPATLRTWDRRYGLGPSDHTQGAHRRYDNRDLERLERMTNLLHQGVSTAEAARIALSVEVAPPAAEPGLHKIPVAKGTSGLTDDQRRRGLARAARALNTPSVIRRLESAIEDLGVVVAWDELIRPVLVEAGLRWQTTGEGVEVEHLLSDCLTSVLHVVISRAPQSRAATRPVLLVCAAGEQHDLPLHVLRAALARRRVKVTLLGAATTTDALDVACRRLGPAAVAVWSQLMRTADAAMLAAVPPMRPAIACFAAGPGWDQVSLPDGAQRLLSLTDAADALVAAAGGTAA